MPRTGARTQQLAAAIQLLCAGLGACSPSAFDGLSGGDRVREEIGLRDASANAEPAEPDAGVVEEKEERDAGAQQVASDAEAPGLQPEDAAQVDAGKPGAATADAAASMDAAADARVDADAAITDATSAADTSPPAVDAGTVVSVQLPILGDRDDALWRTVGSQLEELLHFGPSDGAAGYTIEVGTDGEMCRLGLRFALPFGQGTEVLSAKLALRRVGPASNADSTATMAVRVFESDSVLPFDGAHTHGTPGLHDPGGIWLGQTIGGYAVGRSDAWTESPDLTALVQHVVDRSGFRAGNYIGFVLSPEVMPGSQYAQFRDSFAGEDPAVLTVSYRR